MALRLQGRGHRIHARNVTTGAIEAGNETRIDGVIADVKRIGMVEVTAFAACAEMVPPVAAITATCRRTKSAARV
jgi:hypothetical protein